MGWLTVTPFKEDKNIDLDALDRLLDSLVEAKVDYIVVAGTTGETPALFPEEKQLIKNRVRHRISGRIPLVIGVGRQQHYGGRGRTEEGRFRRIRGCALCSPLLQQAFPRRDIPALQVHSRGFAASGNTIQCAWTHRGQHDCRDHPAARPRLRQHNRHKRGIRKLRAD